MVTAPEALKILNRLTTELNCRLEDIRVLDAAYRGEFALKFASNDFAEYFKDQYSGFSDNWTQVVADAPHERLGITGIRHNGAEKGDGDLWTRWLENEADAYSDLAFLDAIIAKRSYALVWGDREGKATVTWEHPSQAIVSYDPETRKRVAGAKIWCDDEHDYATLYLPDSVWKWQRVRGYSANRPSGLVVPEHIPSGWEMRQPATDDTWPLSNPLGFVPLVEFQNKPRLIGEPLSDIAGTLSMQHAINLLWAQLFVATDSTSLPSRVVTGAERPSIPVLNEDGQEVGRKPVELKKIRGDRTLWLEDPAAKIDEWSAGNLEVFTKIIDKAVGHISSQSRTPSTYFMGGGSGTIANVGDDSLKPLETGLVMRTREKTEHFGRSAREVFRLMALVEGDEGKAASVATGTVLWKDVENRSDAQRADALVKKKSIGYPLRYLMELDGLNDPEIDRVMEMVDEEGKDVLLEAALTAVVKPEPPTPNAVNGV